MVALGGGWVLLRGAALADVARALAVAIEVARRRDGLEAPPRVLQLAELLRREARVMAAPGHAATPTVPDPAECPTELDTAAAAVALGCSERTVRRRAAELGGRRVGRAWLYEPAAVAAAARERNNAA